MYHTSIMVSHVVEEVWGGGEKERHLWPCTATLRLVQNASEGKTSYELRWKVKLMTKKQQKSPQSSH